MKILIAPDSFKGSLSAIEFCEICENTLKKILPDVQIDMMPVADGGEGTLECIKNSVGCKGKIESCYVQNSLFDEVSAEILMLNDGQTAVIEAAMANGLPQIKGRENPEKTSTFGVGQMINHAINSGARKVILGLGGSSTNDCGLGMLAAMGGTFLDKNGNSFVPVGGTLLDVEKTDFSKLNLKIQNIQFEAMCDVKNPLYGPNGCSAVFGPQKGADEKMVQRLDAGCRHIAALLNQITDVDFSMTEGAGAAGGLGYAVIAGLNGNLKSGIDTVLDLCQFDERINDVDLIITGEGSFDKQSVMGKTIGGILNRSRGIPVVVFCGKTDGTQTSGIKDVVVISKGQNLEYAITHAKENLEKSIKEYFNI